MVSGFVFLDSQASVTFTASLNNISLKFLASAVAHEIDLLFVLFMGPLSHIQAGAYPTSRPPLKFNTLWQIEFVYKNRGKICLNWLRQGLVRVYKRDSVVARPRQMTERYTLADCDSAHGV